MTRFYPLKINDLRRETNECVSLAFDVPTDLQTVFNFKAGQYLTLRTTIDGADLRRSYSICSAPQDGEMRVAVKEVDGGVFSTHVNRQLKKGDILQVLPPSGAFSVPLEKPPSGVGGHLVFIAVGSGITPVISNIKSILKNEPLSNCTLIYGNRRTASVIFREEIEALKNKNMQRLRVIHLLSRERTDVDLLHGRLDSEKIKQLFDRMPDLLEADGFYLCGPEDMILNIKSALANRHIAPSKIHFELFGTGKKATNREPQAASNREKPTSTATIRLDGVHFDVPIFQNQAILDAALDAGADLPFACKGGVCCTCRAKLTAGTVEMSVNYALTDVEVAAGFILTCQAVPTTERVVVDFDVK